MLKAKRNAYDGRGNLPVNSAEEAASCFASLSNGGLAEVYAERWCPFAKELAVRSTHPHTLTPSHPHNHTPAHPLPRTTTHPHNLTQVMVARSAGGKTASYPVVETVHKDTPRCTRCSHPLASRLTLTPTQTLTLAPTLSRAQVQKDSQMHSLLAPARISSVALASASAIASAAVPITCHGLQPWP